MNNTESQEFQMMDFDSQEEAISLLSVTVSDIHRRGLKTEISLIEGGGHIRVTPRAKHPTNTQLADLGMQQRAALQTVHAIGDLRYAPSVQYIGGACYKLEVVSFCGQRSAESYFVAFPGWLACFPRLIQEWAGAAFLQWNLKRWLPAERNDGQSAAAAR